MKQLKLAGLKAAAVMVALVLTAGAAIAAEAGLMTKEELLKVVDDENIVILDVRQGRDWSSSEFKIKGAVRAVPAQFDEWSKTYPKDKTLVLYCA